MDTLQTKTTQLLQQWCKGDAAAFNELMPLVYDNLRQVAKKQMAWQSPGHTLQPTAIVNEVYIQLIGTENVNWENRTHFFAYCITIMRRMLIDHFRRHQRKVQLEVEGMAPVAPEQNIDLLELDEALSKLATFDPRKSQIIEMRFFGGMKIEEIAEVLDVAEITVKRDWAIARGWLKRELSGGKSNDE
jgi:RNA polymerase sigma-70 factor, ECF subfamily